MKLIICLAFMLISAKECDKNKTQMSDNMAPETSSELAEMRMQEQVKVAYRASTRGFFQLIEIDGDSIMITNDYNLKDIKKYALPKEEKEAFSKLMSELDVSKLGDIESPSKTHQYDAAPAAFLKVTKGDEVYMTQSFDHGKPPKTLDPIIEKILSLKTMFENQ